MNLIGTGSYPIRSSLKNKKNRSLGIEPMMFTKPRHSTSLPDLVISRFPSNKPASNIFPRRDCKLIVEMKRNKKCYYLKEKKKKHFAIMYSSQEPYIVSNLLRSEFSRDNKITSLRYLDGAPIREGNVISRETILYLFLWILKCSQNHLTRVP